MERKKCRDPHQDRGEDNQGCQGFRDLKEEEKYENKEEIGGNINQSRRETNDNGKRDKYIGQKEEV